MYQYKATVVRIVDADTIKVFIDLGFGIDYTGEQRKGVSLRLAGINTPEIRGEERPKGLIAKERVENLVPIGTEIIINSYKDDKYHGRWVAEIFAPIIVDEELEYYDLAELLVSEGLAKVYDGTGSKPKFPLNESYPLEVLEDENI